MQVKLSSITDFREDVQKCMRCGFCLALCPTEKYMGFESNSPRGRMQTIKALIDGKIRVNNYVMDRLYNCSLCGYCLWRCPPGVKTVDAIEATRAYFVENNCIPQKHREFADRIEKCGNPYGEHPEKRLAWKPVSLDLPRKSRVLYFVGCTSSFRLPEIARSTVRLLRSAKIDFTMIPQEICCGSIMLRTGMRAVAKKIAERNLKMIEEVGARTVVFSCPGCYETFVKDYPYLLEKHLDYDFKHISEYLVEIDDLRFSKPVDATVTYHDPCHLGRHLGIFEAPREFVNRIPGLRLVEMQRSKMTAFCCGAGGGVRGAFSDISVEIAKERVQESCATEATVISSACPFCQRNLRDAVTQLGKQIKVHDIVELAAMSIEE